MNCRNSGTGSDGGANLENSDFWPTSESDIVVECANSRVHIERSSLGLKHSSIVGARALRQNDGTTKRKPNLSPVGVSGKEEIATIGKIISPTGIVHQQEIERLGSRTNASIQMIDAHDLDLALCDRNAAIQQPIAAAFSAHVDEWRQICARPMIVISWNPIQWCLQLPQNLHSRLQKLSLFNKIPGKANKLGL